MHIELGIAVNFIVSHLYNRLPRRRVNLFADELENGLKNKFKGHWHVDDACKGSAYRCIRVSGDKMDQAVSVAIQLSGLDIGEIMQIIPAELTLWIDPKEVTYRTGESGYMKLLYSARNQPTDNDNDLERELGIARDTLVPLSHALGGVLSSQNTFQPIDIAGTNCGGNGGGGGGAGGANSSSNSLRVSPISPANSSPATFTAAMFAQTKFGSTKLKSNKKQCPVDINQRADEPQDDSPWRKMLLAN